MKKQNTAGRPALINSDLVEAICQAVEIEITPVDVIRQRFSIQHRTFWNWKLSGRAAIEKPEAELSDYEKLCRQLVLRLDELRKQQQQTLIDTIREPSHAKTALLVLSLMPDWNFVEDFRSI